MVRSIDSFGFVHWAMIEPEDHIAVRVEVGTRHGYRFVRNVRKNRQRACRIEPNAPHGLWINVVLADCALNSYTDASPDIVRRLFLDDRESIGGHTKPYDSDRARKLEHEHVHNILVEVAKDQCSQRLGRQYRLCYRLYKRGHCQSQHQFQYSGLRGPVSHPAYLSTPA